MTPNRSARRHSCGIVRSSGLQKQLHGYTYIKMLNIEIPIVLDGVVDIVLVLSLAVSFPLLLISFTSLDLEANGAAATIPNRMQAHRAATY